MLRPVSFRFFLPPLSGGDAAGRSGRAVSVGQHPQPDKESVRRARRKGVGDGGRVVDIRAARRDFRPSHRCSEVDRALDGIAEAAGARPAWRSSGSARRGCPPWHWKPWDLGRRWRIPPGRACRLCRGRLRHTAARLEPAPRQTSPQPAATNHTPRDAPGGGAFTPFTGGVAVLGKRLFLLYLQP